MLSKLFKSIHSFAMGEIMPLPFCLARISKSGGKRSRGRTKEWTLQGNFSGGVGSSICTGKQRYRVGVQTVGGNLRLCQILAVAQTISRLFSLWLTIVLTLRLIT